MLLVLQIAVGVARSPSEVGRGGPTAPGESDTGPTRRLGTLQASKGRLMNRMRKDDMLSV